MGLRGVTEHFDKLVRPETTSLANEKEIFGRDKELDQVLGFLNVPKNSKRKRAAISINASASTSRSNHVSNSKRKRAAISINASASTSRSNHVSNKSKTSSLPVLPIVGIGGVGKTTLAQHICSHQRVRTHFELIIWICVSDDFDVKRLTKEVLQSCARKEATTDNLNSLQGVLSDEVNNKRLLIVLDDIWDDALRENGQCWQRFCAPFKSVQEGSLMLVTTRCPKVTEGVRTMGPVILDGLKDDVFWNFFKLCVFGSESSSNHPELERIGRKILPKLRGSPLAAKTLGRMLSMDLRASHWNFILESELWELRQGDTDILPALRLSYMYLPFYLKQCFAFCAVYPKDYRFEKEYLAEIWAAEGFVEPQGGVPILDIGCQYFEDLVARSFFQEVSGNYVIHDLLHDMAQMVSEHDCFILRSKSGFDKVPPNVGHLYIFPSSEFDDSDLLRLCKFTNLRTLFCMKNLGGKASFIMDLWCTKLLRMRVISCAGVDELPDSIGNWKHLRCLQISDCVLKRIPSTFCKLISLHRFVSNGLSYGVGGHTVVGREIRLLKNLNQFRGHLEITKGGTISKDHAAEAELKNKKCLDKLTLDMDSTDYGSQTIHDNVIEVLQVMQPPISLKSLFLRNYAGVLLPSWFQPQNLPSVKSLTFVHCVGLKSISFPVITRSINSNEIPGVIFCMSLTDLTINGCENISSLEDFLHPDYVPAIKKIRIEKCKMLASIPTEVFGDFHSLEELDIVHCPNIRLQRLVSPSLKKLCLCGSGLFCNIDCCSLTDFYLVCEFVISIQLQMWSLPSLRELAITCKSLASIGGSNTAFLSLNVLIITCCEKLSTLDDLLTQEYVPAIEKVHIKWCPELLSLPGERFGSFPYLKHLAVFECPSLNWEMGLVLPSYLQSLSLQNCGDISPYVPSCLQNLTSLISVSIGGKSITSIPGNIWRTNLTSLEELSISDCPDLVSIGGAKAVANIKRVFICGCPKLNEADQINRRYNPRDWTWTL